MDEDLNVGRQVVLLLGAGASVADVSRRPLRDRPPLDKGFFKIARSVAPGTVEPIAQYMHDTYDINICDQSDDSLEGVMGRIYPDLFNPSLAGSALSAFRSLLQLFTERLARTTNNLHATQKRFLYRMLSGYLAQGLAPEQMTIVTFNQDLQVEKTLELLRQARRWARWSQDLFCFPHLYSIGAWRSVTEPRGSRSQLFESVDADRPGCLRLLKLHGSLNWYSIHSSSQPSPRAMFNPDRKLNVTKRKTIDPNMPLRGKVRSQYTLPVVVPPVNHKSAVLHNNLQTVWRQAEDRIKRADELVIFGYSCPPLDFESSNMLRRTHRQRPRGATTSIIDPDGNIAGRYVTLLEAEQLRYFSSATTFLTPS